MRASGAWGPAGYRSWRSYLEPLFEAAPGSDSSQLAGLQGGRWGGGSEGGLGGCAVHVGVGARFLLFSGGRRDVLSLGLFSRFSLTLTNFIHSSSSNSSHWRNLTAHHLPLFCIIGCFQACRGSKSRAWNFSLALTVACCVILGKSPLWARSSSAARPD